MSYMVILEKIMDKRIELVLNCKYEGIKTYSSIYSTLSLFNLKVNGYKSRGL